MAHYSKSLFSRAKKGSIKEWHISVEGSTDKAYITIITKTSETAQPVSRTEIISSGKNIGKKNETSPLEQAISEAIARAEEKILKKGYVEDKKTLSSVLVNSFGLPLPMLAKSLEKEIPDDQFLVQPKLNGHRALYSIKKSILYSRGGIQIETMSHITEELSRYFKEESEDIVLDGELYCHGVPLQEQTRWIKKFYEKDSPKINYCVYDIIYQNDYDLKQRLRLEELESIIDSSKIKYTYIAPTKLIRKSELAEEFKDCVQSGYEGLMIRRLNGLYEPGMRSSNLLKIKPTYDGEWKVKDIYEGSIVSVNGTDQTPVRILCTGSCGDFEVTAPGTKQQQKEILKNKLDYIGKQLTIKYYDLTKDGKPFHPVALQFRIDI